MSFGTFLVNTPTVQSSCLALRKKNLMANPVAYQWQTVYLSAVLETEPSFMSGRILEVEAWLAMAQRLTMPMLIDGPKQRGDEGRPARACGTQSRANWNSIQDDRATALASRQPKLRCYPAVPFPLQSRRGPMQKSALIAALRTESHRHDFSNFVDEPP